jgi:hypothetical protein
MYFKIKLNRNVYLHGRDKRVIETYFTEAQHFADAGMKVINKLGKDIEIEDICLMKKFKPAANEYYEDSKIFAVKVAEDIFQDDGSLKTIKYALPVFAKTSDEVHQIMKDYISQGLENMRITTISETKWIWL